MNDTINWLQFKEHLIFAKSMGWSKWTILSRITPIYNPKANCPFLCADCPKLRKPYAPARYGDIPGWSCYHDGTCICEFNKSSGIWMDQADWYRDMTNPKKAPDRRAELRKYLKILGRNIQLTYFVGF